MINNFGGFFFFKEIRIYIYDIEDISSNIVLHALIDI